MNTDAQEQLNGQERNAAHIYLAAHRTRVLLAEDDVEMRSFLASSLRRDGYEVVAVSNGAELLEHLGTSIVDRRRYPAPAVIISDILMPGPTGLQVLAGLRHSHWTTPVVLITAFGDEQTHDAARSLGADAIFDKPFDVDDLRTVVLHLVSAHKKSDH